MRHHQLETIPRYNLRVLSPLVTVTMADQQWDDDPSGFAATFGHMEHLGAPHGSSGAPIPGAWHHRQLPMAAPGIPSEHLLQASVFGSQEQRFSCGPPEHFNVLTGVTGDQMPAAFKKGLLSTW